MKVRARAPGTVRGTQRGQTPLSGIEGAPGGEEMAKAVPINVNQKHLSNSERQTRQKAEERLRAGANKLRCPSWLSPEAKKEFRRLAKMLQRLDVVCDLHSDLLAVFANTLVAYREVDEAICVQGLTVIHTNKAGAKNEIPNPLLSQRKQLADQLRMFGIEFGLTPSALAKLAIPKEPAKEPTAFEEMFGNVIPMRREAK